MADVGGWLSWYSGVPWSTVLYLYGQGVLGIQVQVPGVPVATAHSVKSQAGMHTVLLEYSVQCYSYRY